MYEIFQKYKQYLDRVITDQNIVEITHLVEMNKLRQLYYFFGEAVFLIVYEYQKQEQKFESCAKFRDHIDVMNCHDGSGVCESLEEYIQIQNLIPNGSTVS